MPHPPRFLPLVPCYQLPPCSHKLLTQPLSYSLRFNSYPLVYLYYTITPLHHTLRLHPPQSNSTIHNPAIKQFLKLTHEIMIRSPTHILLFPNLTIKLQLTNPSNPRLNWYASHPCFLSWIVINFVVFLLLFLPSNTRLVHAAFSRILHSTSMACTRISQRSPVSLQKTSVCLTKAPECTPRAHAKRDSLSEWTRWCFNQSPTWRYMRRIWAMTSLVQSWNVIIQTGPHVTAP
jgi:hypothetical protein